MKNKKIFLAALSLALTCVFAQNPAAVMAEGGQGDPLEEAQKKAEKIVKETPPPFDAASLEGTLLGIYLTDPRDEKTLKQFVGRMKIESMDEHFIECENPRSTCKDAGISVIYRFKVKEIPKDSTAFSLNLLEFSGDEWSGGYFIRKDAVESIQGEAYQLRIRFLNNLVTDVSLEREAGNLRDHYWIGFEHKTLFPMSVQSLLFASRLTGIPMKHSLGAADPKTHSTHWKDEEPIVMVLNQWWRK